MPPKCRTVAKKVWLDMYTGGKNLQKNWINLHTLIDIPSRVVLLMNVTPGVTGDCPTMVEMIKKLLKFLKQANGCFDSTYLSGEFCNLWMSPNLTPFIKPKSNTKRRTMGSWSWRDMVATYQDNGKEFDKHYHQRSMVKAVYAAIKAMYGDSLLARLLKTQTVVTMMHVISYNVEMATGSMIKAESLTEQYI